MSLKPIKDLLASESAMDEVVVQGWVRTKRDGKDVAFLEINDGSCLKNIQAVVEQSCPNFVELKNIGTGASVRVGGRLAPSPGKGQKWEIQAGKIEIIGFADQETYPLQKKRHSDEFLRTIAHLRPRTNKFGAMFRIRSELSFAVHEYFRNRGFFYVHTPIISGSDCEGAGDMFRVTTHDLNKMPDKDVHARDFFGREAMLTVSGQLSAEALALALGKVYTFGPTFRAENSNTARHAAEFWMIEPEAAFFRLADDMNLAEDFLKSVVKAVWERCPDDFGLFAEFVDKSLPDTLNNVINEPFARISYTEAVNLLRKSGKKFEFEPAFGSDLQTEHERWLAEECFGKPVMVYDYPKEIKAFYMRQNDDGRTVAAMDVLLPRVGEIIGGSEREDRPDVLESRMNALGLKPGNYWWYTDLRRFGSVPHSGFGAGFERLLMFITSTPNIRDVIPFPRTPKHLEF